LCPPFPYLPDPRGRRYNTAVQIRLGRHSLVLLMPFFISFCSSPPRGIIVLCAGDSITAEAYPHFLQQLLNRERIRAKVLNFGRSGYASGEYRRFLEENGERLKKERPDFILLQLGTNDVRVDGDHADTDAFAANMKAILAMLGSFTDRTGRPGRILLATIPPVPENTPLPFSPESSRRVTEEINPAIRALAAETGIPLVDNHALFAGRPDLLPGVHPVRDGYRLLAANWLAALKPLLKR
jgi:lysophospholipase L1-like esterase